jgi:hypothetical protein
MSKDMKRQIHSDYRDISISQMSNANNVILGFATGFIIFCLDKCEKNPFNWDLAFSFKQLFLVLCLISLLFSILYGMAVLICRLYDFRITRHIALTRLRDETLEDYTEFKNANMCDRIASLKRVLFEKIKFIPATDSRKNKTNKNDFNNLRELCVFLGDASWTWMKFQFFYFVLGCFFFVFYFLLT